MMKKFVLATGVACGVSLASGAYAADKVTIQLKWVTQAQFAGYYVAARQRASTRTPASTSPSIRAVRTSLRRR